MRYMLNGIQARARQSKQLLLKIVRTRTDSIKEVSSQLKQLHRLPCTNRTTSQTVRTMPVHLTSHTTRCQLSKACTH